MTGINRSCGACKFLRRKCTSECVFGPYFRYDEANVHFGAVHKVFGASNVTRLLIHLPEQYRSEAALSLTYEALARFRDPVYGCVAYIYALEQEVANLQEEIEVWGNHMANNVSNTTSDEYLMSSSQATNNNNLMNNFQQTSSLIQHHYSMNNINLQDYYSHHSSTNYEHQPNIHNPSTLSGHGSFNTTHTLMIMDHLLSVNNDDQYFPNFN
ncbi:hypothetical protein vseg_002409 [Gypsophila vaccaria]